MNSASPAGRSRADVAAHSDPLVATGQVPPDAAEALRRAGPGAALSHESAATGWAIELVDATRRRLTVPRNRSRLQLPGWEVVRSDLGGDDVVELEDVRRTTPLRTVQDLCRVLPFAPALVAADSAVRLGIVSTEELVASLAGAFGRGSGRLHRVGAAVDAGSGSVLETLLRILFLAVVPRPITQHEIRDRWGCFVARVDLCWPAARLIVEADGFAYHSSREDYRRDRERLNELERLGWRVLRFTWEDVVGRPDHVVAVVAECLRTTR